MSFDLSIIGIVFALILLIVFFSAVVLYLSFRIKETFRRETGRGATAAKVAFLIGILFLAGGMFYFFGNSIVTVNQHSTTSVASPTSTPLPSISSTATPTPSPSLKPSQHPGNTPTPSPTVTPSPSSPPTPTTTATPPPTITPTPTSTPTPLPSSTPAPSLTPQLSLSVSYPSTAKMGMQITVTFTVFNPLSYTVHNGVIQTNVLFQDFVVQSSNFPIQNNLINIGDLPAGTTTVTVQLLAPTKPQTVTDTASLMYEGMTNQVTQQIAITVRGN